MKPCQWACADGYQLNISHNLCVDLKIMTNIYSLKLSCLNGLPLHSLHLLNLGFKPSRCSVSLARINVI